MVAILNDLHEDDHFGLVQFDDTILTWKDSLTKATERNVARAMTYAKKLEARGGENKTKSQPSLSLNVSLL